MIFRSFQRQLAVFPWKLRAMLLVFSGLSAAAREWSDCGTGNSTTWTKKKTPQSASGLTVCLPKLFAPGTGSDHSTHHFFLQLSGSPPESSFVFEKPRANSITVCVWSPKNRPLVTKINVFSVFAQWNGSWQGNNIMIDRNREISLFVWIRERPNVHTNRLPRL